MTCVYHDANKDGWRLETWIRGVKRKLWLGAISKGAAAKVRENVHALKLAAETGTAPEPHVAKWAAAVGKRLADQLAKLGLILPRGECAASFTVETLMDRYLATERNKSWSASYRGTFEKLKQEFGDYFGQVTIDRITDSHAKDFAAKVYSEFAESTAGSKVKRARQLFAFAIDLRLIDSNPFRAVKVKTGIDKTRKAYITLDAAELILDRLPDQLWRTIFTFARFGGVRIPSEILTLKWTAIDWHNHRITITSPKGRNYAHRATRVIPMVPMLKDALTALHSLAPEGAVWVCDRYRSTSSSQFRKPLLQAIEKAALEAWPKLYVNLRASCRTDMLKKFEPHIVDDWLGHDGAVGSKHYDRITEADFAKATAPTIAPTLSKSTRKTSKKHE